MNILKTNLALDIPVPMSETFQSNTVHPISFASYKGVPYSETISFGLIRRRLVIKTKRFGSWLCFRLQVRQTILTGGLFRTSQE